MSMKWKVIGTPAKNNPAKGVDTWGEWTLKQAKSSILTRVLQVLESQPLYLFQLWAEATYLEQPLELVIKFCGF